MVQTFWPRSKSTLPTFSGSQEEGVWKTEDKMDGSRIPCCPLLMVFNRHTRK